MQTNTTSAQPKKLLDQVRDKIRFKHYSLSTEKTYIAWIKRFILYHHKRHPLEMGSLEVVGWFRDSKPPHTRKLENNRIKKPHDGAEF